MGERPILEDCGRGGGGERDLCKRIIKSFITIDFGIELNGTLSQLKHRVFMIMTRLLLYYLGRRRKTAKSDGNKEILTQDTK